MSTPNKLRVTTSTMSAHTGSPSHGVIGRNTQFRSMNPLDAIAHLSDNSTSSRKSGAPLAPPNAIESSPSAIKGKMGTAGIPILPSTPKREKIGLQQPTRVSQAQVMGALSPEKVRHMTGTPTISSAISSPVQPRIGGPDGSFGHVSRRGSILSQSSPGKYSPGSIVSNRDSVGSYVSNGRLPTVSGRTKPTMLHPCIVEKQTMNGIHECLAVEEFAFRRGQQDRISPRARIPINPFGPKHDELWEAHYIRGKESTTPAVQTPLTSSSPSRPNYAWPVLIKSLTQTPEHPNGSYDAAWVKTICTAALRAMSAVITKVLQRPTGWQKFVCDVPAPIAEAISEFPELGEWYELLKQDAHEALSGGRPQGYDNLL